MNSKDTSVSQEKYSSIVEKLSTALLADGDFPTRAQVVLKIKTLAHSPKSSINEIAELIMGEASLGPRILHLVNSAYYQSARSITTISEAIVRIGMRELTDVIASFVMMQQFNNTSKLGEVFQNNLKKSILTSLIASSLAEKSGNQKLIEQSFLAGTFLNLGYLLLAYYFPNLFETAALRAQVRGHSVSTSLAELLGTSAEELSLAIVKNLKIPVEYETVISAAKQNKIVSETNVELQKILISADRVAESVTYRPGLKNLKEVTMSLSQELQIDTEGLVAIIKSLPESFSKRCQVIEVKGLSLPENLELFSLQNDLEVSQSPEQIQSSYAPYLKELVDALENKEPTSSFLTLGLEALVKGVHFNRALILFLLQDKLVPKLQLGDFKSVDISKLSLTATEDSSLIKKSITDSSPSFGNNTLFKDGSFGMCIPLKKGEQHIGLMYAEVVSPFKGLEGKELEAALKIAALIEKAFQ